MVEDTSIYQVALEWLRVPIYVLPGVIVILGLLGVVFLRNSRVANIKTKEAAAQKACNRVEQISDCLDVALGELRSSVPPVGWDPLDPRPSEEGSSKESIDPRTDERCRDLIDHLDRICDAHLPEFRARVLKIEALVREFAQQRREVLSGRNTLSRLESQLMALSSEELDALTKEQSGQGWGQSFDDPTAIPGEQDSRVLTGDRIVRTKARPSTLVVGNGSG